jgi:LDH2 family malate/lactate/ureidoglycolate dehydrogenase
LKSSSTLPGVKEIRVPGEGAARMMAERMRQGIPLTPELFDALNTCAKESGVALLSI